VDSGLPAVLDVEIDKEVIPPDFEVAAAIWLEGCEFPEPEKPPQQKVRVAVAGASSA